MSNQALYGLILVVCMVLALGGGITLINWVFRKLKEHGHAHQTHQHP